jgi:hypothetical protein
MEEAVPIVNPAVWTASSLGQPEEVRRLLRGGADIDEKGGAHESTPLLEAIRNRATNLSAGDTASSNDYTVKSGYKTGKTMTVHAYTKKT